MARGEATALYLPLLFLVRGRLTEALAAHARLLRSGVPSRLQGTPLLPPLHIPCSAPALLSVPMSIRMKLILNLAQKGLVGTIGRYLLMGRRSGFCKDKQGDTVL